MGLSKLVRTRIRLCRSPSQLILNRRVLHGCRFALLRAYDRRGVKKTEYYANAVRLERDFFHTGTAVQVVKGDVGRLVPVTVALLHPLQDLAQLSRPYAPETHPDA